MKKITYPYHRREGLRLGMSGIDKIFPIIRGTYSGLCATVVPYNMGMAHIRIHHEANSPYGPKKSLKLVGGDVLSYITVDSRIVHPTSKICRTLHELGVDMKVVFDRYEAKEDWLKANKKRQNPFWVAKNLYVQETLPRVLAGSTPHKWKVFIGERHTSLRFGFRYEKNIGFLYKENNKIMARLVYKNTYWTSPNKPGRKVPHSFASLKGAVTGILIYDKFKNPGDYGPTSPYDD